MAEPRLIDDGGRQPMSGWMKVLLALALLILAAVAVSVVRTRASNSTHRMTANQAARQSLEQQGIDPNSTLAYTHYLYFDSKDRAELAAAALRSDFEIEVHAPSGDVKEWAVFAQQVVALDESALDAVVERVTRVTENWGGEYDGWDVPTGA